MPYFYLFGSQLIFLLYFFYKLSFKSLISFNLNKFFITTLPFVILISSGFRVYSYSVYDDLFLIVLFLFYLKNFHSYKFNFNIRDILIILLIAILLFNSIVGFFTYKNYNIFIYIFYFFGILTLSFFLIRNYLSIDNKNISIYFDILIFYFLIIIIFNVISNFFPILFEDFSQFINNDRCEGINLNNIKAKHFNQCFQNIFISGSTLSILPITYGYILIFFNFKNYKIKTILLLSLFLFYINISESEAGIIIFFVTSFIIILLNKDRFRFLYYLIISLTLSFGYEYINLKTLDRIHSNLDKENLIYEISSNNLKKINFKKIYFHHFNTLQNNELSNEKVNFSIFFDKEFLRNYNNNIEINKIIQSIDDNSNKLYDYDPRILLEYQKIINSNFRYKDSNYFYKYIDLKKYFGIDKIINISTSSIGSRLQDLITIFDPNISIHNRIFGHGLYSSRLRIPKLQEATGSNSTLFLGQEIEMFGLEYSLNKLTQQGKQIIIFGEDFIIFEDLNQLKITMIYVAEFIFEFGLIAFLLFVSIIFLNMSDIIKRFNYFEASFLIYILIVICLWSFLTDLSNNFVFFTSIFYSYLINFFISKKKL